MVDDCKVVPIQESGSKVTLSFALMADGLPCCVSVLQELILNAFVE
jgi:hypothetical protein